MILANHGIISSSGALPSTLLNNLYAVYKAENNSNDSLGNYNGTAIGGLTYTTGQNGNAFNLNGTTSYIDMGDVMDIGTSSWSYSMRINTNDVSGGILFAKTRAAALSGRLWAGFNAGKLYFAFDVTDALTIVIETTTTYSTNTWYNFTCILDRSSNLKMYVNGSLASYTSLQHTNDMTPYTSTNYNNNTPFRSGCFTQSDNITPYAFYNGKIDEFNAWNRVLTQSEITELQNKYYPF